MIEALGAVIVFKAFKNQPYNNDKQQVIFTYDILDSKVHSPG
jgi:hypothetical protein